MEWSNSIGSETYMFISQVGDKSAFAIAIRTQVKLQSLRRRRPLEAFCELGRHPRILFDGDNAFCLLQNLRGQITSTRAYLQNNIGLFEVSFLYYCLSDARILENVLPEIRVHLEYIVAFP